MGFAMEAQEEKLQEKAVEGRYREVAVGCWFTSKGRVFLKMLKYEDEEGFRHTIENIQVLKSEKKHYAGILMQRYDCSTEINGVQREFTLLYHPDMNTWEMVWPEN